jgi:hypothetical protein
MSGIDGTRLAHLLKTLGGYHPELDPMPSYPTGHMAMNRALYVCMTDGHDDQRVNVAR